MSSSSVLVQSHVVDPERLRMARGRLLRAHLVDAKYEFVRTFRNPIVNLSLVAIPVAMYAFIGIVLVNTMPLPPGIDKATLQAQTFANWAIFGVMGPAMMTFGIGVASERDWGLLTFKRALPMPPFAYLLSKLFAAALFGAVLILLMASVTALFSDTSITPMQYAQLFAADVLMVLPFSALGLAMGSALPLAYAMALANVVWIGMAMLGGLLFPIPSWIAMWTPTYYAGQVSRAIVGVPTEVSIWLSAGILAVIGLVFGLLSVNRLNATRDD